MKQKLCKCGCGTLIPLKNKWYREINYVNGHSRRGKKWSEEKRLRHSEMAKKKGFLPPWIKERKKDSYRRNTRYKIWVEKIMEKNNGNCVMCNKKANQAHHIKDRIRFPELIYNLENGIPLCKSCHLKVHNPLQYRWGIK